MKLLFISNISGKTAVSSFSKASVLAANELGIEFHLAENFNSTSIEVRKKDEDLYNIKTHHIDFVRAPYDLRNIRAYKQVVKLIRDEKIDVIHCNTPVGGVIGRLAGKTCYVKKTIYEAHGFHFYRGAPLFNWLAYYPIERWLAHYTDVLITINQEDYKRAQSFHLRNRGSVLYVPGVGIDLSAFTAHEEPLSLRAQKRRELHLSNDDFVLISTGELNANKNNKVIVEALGKIKNKKTHYLVCGKGDQENSLKKIAKSMGIEDHVHFLGFRNDVPELLVSSDVFVMPSFREGLSRSLMEAMACGLPCVVSNIRGNSDLIESGKGGFLCDPKRCKEFTDAIEALLENRERMAQFGMYNQERIKAFDIKRIEKDMKDIYDDQTSENN